MVYAQFGDLAGPYQIVSQYGQGGGTVYKAYHPSIGTPCCHQIPPAVFADDPNFLGSRFEREAEDHRQPRPSQHRTIYDFNSL